MNIIKCKVHELSPKDKRACGSLSYRQDGDLYWWLKDHPDGEVVIIKDDTGMILGWGMRVKERPGKYSTGYYVRKSMRRKGIGSKIYYTLNPPYSRFKVFPHDNLSAGFFYSMGKINAADAEKYVDTSQVKRKPRREVMSD